MEKVKTVFIGTSQFAVPILEALKKAEFINLTAVVTQPDRPVGRHQELEAPPVKNKALELGVKNIYQPEKLKNDALRILDREKPELIVVASYGQMISKIMLDYPKYKCLNTHVSIVPDLRGAVPMPMAILRGYEKTGISVLVMTPGLDDGDVVGVKEVSIDKDETTETLTKKASQTAADYLVEILPAWIKGEIEAVAQDDSQANYVGQEELAKEKAEIRFDTPVEIAERMVRAFYPWPVAWMWIEVNGQKKRLKIYNSRIENNKKNSDGLKIVREGKKLLLLLQDGALELLEVQLEGKQKMPASNYFFIAQD